MKIDEVMRIYVIVITFTGVIGLAVGMYAMYQNVTDATGLTVYVAAGVGGGVAICTAISQTLKLVQGMICPYGTYPDCLSKLPPVKTLQNGQN